MRICVSELRGGVHVIYPCYGNEVENNEVLDNQHYMFFCRPLWDASQSWFGAEEYSVEGKEIAVHVKETKEVKQIKEACI